MANGTYYHYLTALFNKIRDIAQTIAQKNLAQIKRRSKICYSRKAKLQNFNAGDFVYLLKESIYQKINSATSMAHIYNRISKILDNNNAEIEISRDKIRIVHMDKLKLLRRFPATTLPPL
ncbi:hypothetical protein ALC56_05552 [Trachymyrmex septentrionalis]|uniref:Uncharacterized protein n=1 Tax=Trachymyrmex septentrionalis TaxID=34720 RepID=A0A151JXW2_9HYME|nr:hypothetical protein ALC56_05552 [Trachymyrmex septentrionalis]